MFRIAFAAMASAWLVGAQEVDDNSYHPHAAFVFVRTGERTPVLRPGSQVLTALGANQMYQLGQNFRTRYITGRSPNGLGVEHITNMSQNVINNDQILVQTNDAPHLVASALAFTQGLYPPISLGSGNSSVGSTGGLLADGRAIDYPLGGYQYASIQASGNNDPEHIYVAGSQTCPIAKRDAMQYFVTSDFQNTRNANKNFYQDNFKADWFEGNLKQGDLSYTYAMEIADYMQYQYAHNSTINRAISNSTLATMQALADREAWYLWGNTSSSSTDADNQAISGKTLASVILGQFQRRVIDQLSPGDKNDMSYPLTFLFGEFEPFISLISLMMADFKDGRFRSIPPYASAMIFELFSTGNTTNFPTSQQDLWVRFYFHNGTSFDAKQLIAFPIFGNGPSRTDMPWLEFQDMFGRIMMNSLNTWCSTCASSALFCTGVNDGNISIVIPGNKGTHAQYPVSPVVSGVIGAIVTSVVAGLLFGLAMLLGGIRLHRVHKDKKSELGGFKGSAKLASDPDLSLAKNGAVPAGLSFGPDTKRGHERVGSWELRQKEFGADVSRRESMDGIDTVSSAKPVQPTERV